MSRKHKSFTLVFFLILFIISLLSTFSLHEKEKNFTWEGTIWADKAGYYIYLPATFFYQFNPEKATEDISAKTGNGFILDNKQHKISTKYTYGVALLLSPFFLAAHWISILSDLPEQDGFSPLYQDLVNLGAVVYLILGLYHLKIILSRYFKPITQYLVLILVYFGTNLFYYTVSESLMSHVYSFFLFSLFLFGLLRFLESKKYGYFLLLAFSASMAIVVRPVNFLILALLIFWDVTDYKGFLNRVMLWIQPRYLIPFSMIFFVCILPQVHYWQYLSGKMFYYSYGDEGFKHWLRPRLTEVWFAPLNGLFLYTPLVIVMVTGMIFMIIKKSANGLLLLFLFLLVSYICAAWHIWYFGSSFGQRSFVEYLVFFSIPLGFVIQKGGQLRFWGLKILGLVVLLSMVYYNIRMTSVYEKVFPGSSWDWGKYSGLTRKAGLLPVSFVPDLFTQDFENLDFSPEDPRASEFFRSGSLSGTFLPGKPVCGRIEIYLYEIGDTTPDTVWIRFWAYKPKLVSTQTDLECFLLLEQDTLFREIIPVDAQIRGIHKWCEVKCQIALPELNRWNGRVLIQFRNKTGLPIFLDDIRVELRNKESRHNDF